MNLSDETRERLASVATATLAGVLHKRGIRSSFLNGLAPLAPGRSMVGIARTLRYLPMREDLIPVYATRTERAARGRRIAPARRGVGHLGPGRARRRNDR